MSYFVVVTFDLKNADWDDYETVYQEFEKIGLDKKIISSEENKILLPSTTVAGMFEGISSSSVRDNIMNKCKKIFKYLRLHGQIFVVVGGNWSWRHLPF